jgi:hypothetical protein
MDGLRDLYVAEVGVTYGLVADRGSTVPVVFPIVGGAQDVRFRLGDTLLPVRLVRDTEVFAAYERDWERAIDRAIRGEPSLRWFGDRVGLGDGAESLVTYKLKNWQATYGERAEGRRDLVRWTELWSKRTLAVALDPQVPDPVALWEDVPVKWRRLQYPPPQEPAFVFAVAELPLAPGANRLDVHFTQPLSVRNRTERATGKYAGQSHAFEFILRTARFWRTFGDLQVEVRLPREAGHVEVTPRTATVSGLLGRRVVLRTSGVPEGNLRVEFARFEWQPEPEAWVGKSGRPAPSLAAALARATEGQWAPDPDSAYRHYLKGEAVQWPWDTIRTWVYVVAGVTVAAGGGLFWRRRRHRQAPAAPAPK